MNMLLVSPKSPLWACVFLGPPYQGQGLPSKFSLARFPKEAAVLQAYSLQTVGTPLALSVYTWAWHDLEISHLYRRAVGIKVTATPMPKVLKNQFCILDWGLLLFVGWDGMLSLAAQFTRPWTCKTSSQPTFACIVPKESSGHPLQIECIDVHFSNCAEQGGAAITAQGDTLDTVRWGGHKCKLWSHSSGFETWHCYFLAVWPCKD